MILTPSAVKAVGKHELRYQNNVNKSSFARKFRSWFGLSPRLKSCMEYDGIAEETTRKRFTQTSLMDTSFSQVVRNGKHVQ